MSNVQELVTRYAAMWNEPDARVRRAEIEALFTPDMAHILEPPQEMAKIAEGLGMTARLEARGYDVMESRVARAYEEFVNPGTMIFRLRDEPKRLGNQVRFHWEAVQPSSGEVLGYGLDILELDADGRIREDCQYIEQ